MKKIQTLLLLLFAMFVISSVAGSIASAAEWLFDGAAITELLTAEITMHILVRATNEPIIGTVDALCSMIEDVTWSPLGVGQIIELLTLAGVAISTTGLSGTGLECENVEKCPTPLLWAEGLPWNTELLSTTDNNVTGEVGYELKCAGVLGEPSDLCHLPSVLYTLENMASPENDVLATVNESETGECTNAGANHFSIVSEEPGAIRALEGLTLAVS